MQLKNIRYEGLNIENWEIKPGETWCLLGGNASGKSLLASILTGDIKPSEGKLINPPSKVGWASFESQQETYEEEIRNQDTDFIDRIDYGSTGLEILEESGAKEEEARAMAESFHLGYILERGYRLLSSGEARRILLLKEILEKPDLLILEEPFEGLDAKSRNELSEICRQLVNTGQKILLLVNRLADVAEWTTHLALLRNGNIIEKGLRDEILDTPEIRNLMELDSGAFPELPQPIERDYRKSDPLVHFSRCRVQYGDEKQFENFDWRLKPGQHTLITGPNGAGKSTLLQLISGDHPQCYSNDIKVFDYQRGTGESIWDIKRNIGIVSAALHRDYRAPGNVLTTVVSGFYDSIGLYEQASAKERSLALQWLKIMGLRDEANTIFRKLSYGQQRLVLIARGLIKQPPLLILDEPTQGLDDLNRHLILSFIEKLAKLEQTTLLFVSHREDEHLALFKNRIRFEKSDKEKVRFQAVVENG